MTRVDLILGRARLGYRGAFLLCCSIIDLGYGWSLLVPTSETRATAAYMWRTHFLPYPVWGLIWIAVGLFLVSQAWSRTDRAAYGIAMAIKYLWAFVGLAGWAFGDVKQGWILSLIFGVFGVMTTIVSRWSEPIDSHTISTMITDDLPETD